MGATRIGVIASLVDGAPLPLFKVDLER
jgi:hypothetical protein